ncbi:hypothetical protein [Azospirillum sp. Sh1]|uniref:hypothetical protein n=1 Tax=Azospirillum sp. Sh1 TaxID=2607285 RepID=UPI0011ED5339|nr:hypothetical protein [Azospirillum sp. Sh1]KAA0571100.1 hypothetical protein FZ029_28000 [Azospirillum sp. Sh1]
MNATKAIAELDLSAVHADLVRRDGMTPAQADAAITMYRQFLTLAALYPAIPVCPPSAADKAWHRHMMRPLAYFDVCQPLFGGPLDHDPDAYGTPEFTAAWGETRRLFREHFGIELLADATALEANSRAPAACYRPLPKAA